MGLLKWLDPEIDNDLGNIVGGVLRTGSIGGGIMRGIDRNREDDLIRQYAPQLKEKIAPQFRDLVDRDPRQAIIAHTQFMEQQQAAKEPWRGVAMRAASDPKIYGALKAKADAEGWGQEIDTPEKLQMFAYRGMKPEDAAPQAGGAFAGTSMDAQIGNILVAAEQNPSLKNTPQYKFAVAQYRQPRVTVGPDGRVVTIQPTLPDFGGSQMRPPASSPMGQPMPQPQGQPSQGPRQTNVPVSGANVSITGDPTPQPIPAEQAARVAMTRAFLQQAPGILKAIKEGKMDGVGDVQGFQGLGAGVMGSIDTALGRGPRGEIMRRLASGQDALIRNLTGAGMPAEEARRYADRYSPSATDTRDTMLSKATQLVYELQNVMQSTMSGRRVAPEMATMPKAPSDQYAPSQPQGALSQGSQGQDPAIQNAIANARAAVAKGKDPVAVAQRLREYGIDPSLAGLQ